MRQLEVSGFGALNFDRVLAIEDYPEPWEDIPLDFEGYHTQVRVPSSSEKAAGGSAANTIYGLGRLGVSTSFIGAVGRDSPGRRMLASFREVDVNTRGIVLKDETATGETYCFAYPNGDRTITIVPGANGYFNADDLKLSSELGLLDARVLHIASFIGNKQFHLQKSLIDSLSPDTLLSFSPGRLYVDRGFDQIESMLARSDYTFFNLDELLEITHYDKEVFDNAARSLLDTFPRTKAIILTLGSGQSRANTIERYLENLSLEPRQSIVFGQNETIEVPVRPSFGDFEDAVGAGDSYTAGFLYGILRDHLLSESALLGSIASRYCITGRGARVGLPTQDQLETALNEETRV